ncbi:MAG: hypothetical protein J0L84_09340 [Verrucomicrobia bacterium]|nr:hypothetical protein [Verrucomicrobiota bacterium]
MIHIRLIPLGLILSLGCAGVVRSGMAPATIQAEGYPAAGVSGAFSTIAALQTPTPLPIARVESLRIKEGDAGTAPARFELRLNRAADHVCRVRYATTNDTARAPGDFTAVAGVLEIAPGETNAVVEVLVHGNTTEEPNKTLMLTFSDVEGMRMLSVDNVPVPAIATIINDDVAPGEARSFTWAAVPSKITVGEPFSAGLTARDGSGDVVTDFDDAVSIRGFAGPGLPSSVVLTEISIQSQRGAELQNVANDAVDVGGWQIHFYDLFRWPAPKLVFTIPAGTMVPPRGVFVVVTTPNRLESPGSYPLFRVPGGLHWWPLTDNPLFPAEPPIGVVVTDAAGGVADTFFAGEADSTQVCVPRILTSEEWIGPPASTTNLPFYIGRPPGQGRNRRTASDWAPMGPRQLPYSFREPNPGLVLPFEEAVALPVTPHMVSAFNGGVHHGVLTLSGFAPRIRLLADDGKGHRGLSVPMAATAADDLEISLAVTPRILVSLEMNSLFEVAVTNHGAVLSSNVTATLKLSPIYGGTPAAIQASWEISQGSVQMRGVHQSPATLFQIEVRAAFGELPPNGVATLRFQVERTLSVPAAIPPLPYQLPATVVLSRQPPEMDLRNNTASVAQELVAACAPLETGVVAWWRADGDGADTIGGNTGNPVGIVDLAEGRVGTGGFGFPHGGGMIRIPASAPLNFSDGESFSVELWCRVAPDHGVFHGLLAKGTPAAGWNGYAITLEEGTVVLRLGDGERSDILRLGSWSRPVERANDWRHLVVSVNRSAAPVARCWIDGIEGTASALTATGNLSNEQPLDLGGAGGNHPSLAGNLDEVILRRAVTSPAQAHAAYEAGGHGHCHAVLEIRPTAPRFSRGDSGAADRWRALDLGVVGQPYRFEFELRNRGPLPAAAHLFVTPYFTEAPYEFRTPLGPGLVNPETGRTSADLGVLAANAVMPMSVVWTPSHPEGRWDLLAAGGDPRVGGAAVQMRMDSQIDTDRDGIPDEYEASSGLDIHSAVDAGSDTDFDGWTAAEEFEAGTRANDADSQLQLITDGSKISVNAVASRQYRLERRGRMASGPWEVIHAFRPETDGVISLDLTVGDSTEVYYRVSVLLPY